MAHGITQEMIDRSKAFRWRAQPFAKTRERDRSLNGKARIKARKAKNKEVI